MLKEVGLLVNCGRWRLKKSTKKESVSINFVLSVEVLESHSDDAIVSLKETIQRAVASWDREAWVELQKQKREQKKKLLQNERKVKHGF